MSLPIRALLAARRRAVTRGEVPGMWPGAAWDLIALMWFRGAGSYHSAVDGCPLCNPRGHQ